MKWLEVATAVLACTLVSTRVSAGSVFLNGVNIDGVNQQKFEKATVRIDDRGNVYIDAPGYSARTVPNNSGSGDSAEEPPRMSKRYWLVAEQPAPGMAEYDIDLYVNSKWIRKLKSSEQQLVTEITKYFAPGKNTVTLRAHKVSRERKTLSGDNFFEVIIGEGRATADNIVIDNPMVRYRVAAAQSEDESKEFVVTAR